MLRSALHTRIETRPQGPFDAFRSHLSKFVKVATSTSQLHKYARRQLDRSEHLSKNEHLIWVYVMCQPFFLCLSWQFLLSRQKKNWHPSSLIAYSALPNHQDDCNSIPNSKTTAESTNDCYDRSLTSRSDALVGAVCSYIISCCIIEGSIDFSELLLVMRQSQQH